MGNLTKQYTRTKPYTIPDTPVLPETEQMSSSLLDVTQLIEDVSALPTEDLIVRQMMEELIDIEGKLAAIQFLKSLEKPLRKRANVIYKFKSQLEEAYDTLVEVGEKEIKPIDKYEATKLNTYINDRNLDEILQEDNNLQSNTLGGNLNDFV